MLTSDNTFWAVQPMIHLMYQATWLSLLLPQNSWCTAFDEPVCEGPVNSWEWLKTVSVVPLFWRGHPAPVLSPPHIAGCNADQTKGDQLAQNPISIRMEPGLSLHCPVFCQISPEEIATRQSTVWCLLNISVLPHFCKAGGSAVRILTKVKNFNEEFPTKFKQIGTTEWELEVLQV
jgi:hypothetical protein